MNIVFMGTPEFAATILDDLVQQYEIAAVYTRPDAVRGRGKNLVSSAVKLIAEREGIPVQTPQSLKDAEAIKQLRSYKPDVICVAAYGALLPQEVLDIPRYGCLNVHASLLPRWRGAAPIERAILAGDKETGVCIMRMEEGLDTGDYSIVRTAWIEDKTSEELSDELANLGSHALMTALIHLEQGAAEWMTQDEELATYASKIAKHELNISLTDSAEIISRKVRASSEPHPSRCIIADRSVTLIKVCEVENAEEFSGLDAGQVTLSQKKLLMGVQGGVLEIAEVKPDGKKTMDGTSFAAGIQGIKNSVVAWDELNA